MFHSLFFQSRYYLPYLFFFRHLFLPHPCRKQSPLDAGLTVVSYQFEVLLSIDSLSLNLPLSHLSVSVSLVSQVRQCVPSTWSSWLRCLMGGSRSRNHLSLFGRLFQMKSSRNQGADGCNHFMHLCSGCYQRTVRRKQYYEQPVFNSATILLYKNVFCRLQLIARV